VAAGSGVSTTCLTSEDTKLSDAFTAADGLGACVNGTGFSAIGPKVMNLVADVQNPLINMGTSANDCTSKKLKAAGKKAFKKANCYSKAVKKGEDVDPACLCKEDAKMTDAFGKAEGLGSCLAGTGDASLIAGTVDAFVVDLVDALTSTTPTSTSTTTTTIPCSCSGGPPTKLSFRTTLGSGACGAVLDNGGANARTLDKGKLYIGGGSTSLLPNTVPDYG